MNTLTCGHLQLHFEKNPIAAFYPIMQKGFYLKIATGNLQRVLCKICDLEPGDLRDRIQTVFLNGKPVDDMETTYVQGGDRLALSAAMPGLVGATMRSGGVLAGFRHSISHRPPKTQSKASSGVLSIKLFNLLIKEVGPRFLRQGILLGPDDLQDLLRSILKVDGGNCMTAQLNAHTISAHDLATMDWPQDQGLIHLEVTFGSSPNRVSSNFGVAENLG